MRSRPSPIPSPPFLLPALPFLAALLALPFSCTRPDGGGGLGTSDAAPSRPVLSRELESQIAAREHVALGHALAGQPVEESTKGAWQARRNAGAPAADGALGKGGGRGDAPKMSLFSGGEGAAPGAMPEPGAKPSAGAVGVTLEAGSARGAAASPDAVAAPRTAPEDISGALDGAPVRASEGVTTDSARVRQPATLRAGSTDDNADFEAFLAYLDEAMGKDVPGGSYDPLDVSGRRWVRVVDVAGEPVPGARITVVDEEADRLLWTALTLGDGRAIVCPALFAITTPPPAAAGALADAARGASPGRKVVQASVAGAHATTNWNDSQGELVVRLSGRRPPIDPIHLDCLFIIDTTGSMGDEIEAIKASLLEVTQKLRLLGKEFDLRYGAVLYRDVGDAYITLQHPFTRDIEAFDSALAEVSANGGGDGPESLNQGLAVAVDRMDWLEGAAKVAFLIADAPPHMDYEDDTPYGRSVRAAVARGIKIHTVAASGLDPVGTLVYRQIAQLTRGKFIFIEYGSLEATAAHHRVEGAVKSNNLHDILYENLRDEVAGWGRG